MNQVIIMRGIPGSGKTTYVEKHFPDAIVCSSDHYFTDETGNYKFDINETKISHQRSRDTFDRALEGGAPLVAVDNTNIRWSEMEYYVSGAEKHRYEVKFIRLEVPISIACERNIHHVPREIIERFANTMDYLPWEYKRKEEIIDEEGNKKYWDMKKERWCRELYTKEQIIDRMKTLAEKYGRTPTTVEIGEWTYVSAVEQFGSLQRARDTAGLKQIMRKKKKQYTKVEVLEGLKQRAKELGRSPSSKEIPSAMYDALRIYFPATDTGCMDQARKAAGLGPLIFPSEFEKGTIKGDVIDGKIVLTITPHKPEMARFIDMAFIASTFKFENMMINGVPIKIDLKLGWGGNDCGNGEDFIMGDAKKNYNKMMGFIEQQRLILDKT